MTKKDDKKAADAAIAKEAPTKGKEPVNPASDLTDHSVTASEMAAKKGGKASKLAATDETVETLAAETAAESASEDVSVHGRLSRSGYVLNENQITGERWIGESIQRDPNADATARAKTRVTNIAEVRPWKGLEVRPKSGEPFVVSDEYDKDSTPAAWLSMLIPGTKQNFIAA